MRESISEMLLAPCGANCTVCYKYHAKKNACPGCLVVGKKPEHCRKCRIKDCVDEKGIVRCFECSAFPCKRVKNLDRSYQKRYQVSLISNAKCARDKGVSAFLKTDSERLKCQHCGGVLIVQDKVCSDCGQKHNEEASQ